jgi:hypothetical protein
MSGKRHPAGDGLVAQIVRRLVEHGVAVVLVAAHAAPQGHVTHAQAVLGSFPCRAAEARHPRDFLRPAAGKRVPERAALRLAGKQ